MSRNHSLPARESPILERLVNAAKSMLACWRETRCLPASSLKSYFSINGNKFVIPEKFYKDFTNTNRLNIFEQKSRVVIELKGGEGAGAYTARFMLGGMCGFERNVCGEICNEIWERTTWYNSFAYEADPQCKSGIR